MTASPRSFTIDYGSTTFGNAPTNRIHDRYSLELTETTFSLEFQALISNTTAASFKTTLDAVEAEVRTPFQDLYLTLNSQELHDFRESTKKGLNTRGRVIKREDVLGNSLAQLLTIRFEGELPADQSAGQPASLEGWRAATVAVVFDESRRMEVTITGEWTAVPTPTSSSGKHARDAYEHATSGVAVYCLSVLTDLSATASWEIQREDYDLDDTDVNDIGGGSVLRYTRVYLETVFTHAGDGTAASTPTAGLQTGSIVKQRLRISRDRSDTGNSPGTTRLLTATCSYDAWIDKTVSTSLETLWDNTIKDFIIGKLRTSGLLSGSIAVTVEAPDFEYDENRISATLIAEGGATGPVIERRTTMEDHDVGGFTTVPIWDGNKRSRYAFDSPIERRRILSETAIVIQDPGQDLDFTQSMGVGIIGNLGGRIIEKHSSATPVVRGTQTGGGTIRTIEITGRMVVIVFDESDGARLQRDGQDSGANPFLFDFNQGVFDLRGGRGGIGLGGAAPIDMGRQAVGGGFIGPGGQSPVFRDVVRGP